ncbi:MAG: DUF4388 domain-containing protein, partial [Actinomycetota bacterium]|nr:DUF4388 domain-containing protein [Actinomycetota bacterium]
MLKGTLGHFTMPEIFRLVSSHRTGCLHVRTGDADGTLYFREGTVYFARSSLTSEPLGKRLVGSRDLTERQLKQALEVHNRTGSNLGEILVDLGFITHDRLAGALRLQIEDAVVDLLAWDEGEFEWQPGVGIDVEFAVTARVEDLIIEASRRLDESSVIDRKIPSIDLVPSMSPDPPADAEEINIAANEWRALVLADGHRTIGEIAATVGIDAFTARRTFYALEAAGLVEISSSRNRVSGRASSTSIAGRPLEEPDSASSSTFDAYSAWLPSTSQEEAEDEFRRAAGLDFDDDKRVSEEADASAPAPETAPTSGFLDDLFNERLVLGSTADPVTDEIAGQVDPAFSELEAPLREIADALRSEEPGAT